MQPDSEAEATGVSQLHSEKKYEDKCLIKTVFKHFTRFQLVASFLNTDAVLISMHDSVPLYYLEEGNM